MNPYDHAAVSAVWQRVTQGQKSDDLEAALSAAIADERHAQKTYLALSQCGYTELFRHLAAQEACHAKKLSALYYLLFGCPPCQSECCKIKICNFCESVRKAYQGELEAAKNYKTLAACHPEHAQLFCAIMKTERCHAEHLRTLTEKLLHP